MKSLSSFRSLEIKVLQTLGILFEHGNERSKCCGYFQRYRNLRVIISAVC